MKYLNIKFNLKLFFILFYFSPFVLFYFIVPGILFNLFFGKIKKKFFRLRMCL